MAFKLEIYTSQEKVFEEEVESVLLNSLAGKIQILSRHVTTIVAIVPGIIEIKTNRDKIRFEVLEGLLDFEKDKCKIFTSFAKPVEK
ncbi:MAG: hypothetical protein N2486_04815 [Caloramator sp.]|nr:hypothetical protein [Caloramator sp.]